MFAEDLSQFFREADFSVPVTLPGGSVVQGIFDNGYAQGGVGATGMASAQPTVTLPSALVPANPVGQVVGVGGLSYSIAHREPDGTGVDVLSLEKA